MRLRSKHIREGRRRRELTRDIPSDPSSALAHVTSLIHRYGWKLEPKPGFFKGGWKWATTLRRRIWLQANWNERSTAAKVRILYHELVHIRQRRRLGHGRFVWRWLRARWRWALEVAAYHETVRVMRALGDSDREIDQWITARVGKLRKSYRLRKIGSKQFSRETLKILRS
jgi:hypothetical protein